MKKKLFTIIAVLALIFSCKTYTVPVDSFREQMSISSSEKLRDAEINNPINTIRNIKYEANNIKLITVIDKKGNQVELKNSPKLEMRVTKKNKKKYILLFDTVIVVNDTLKGARSRLLKNLTREISLKEIEKIEIQDSGKVYKYQ